MQKTHSEWNYKWNCLRRPYPLKFLKGCLPQNLLNPLLNTLPEISFTWILQILKSVNLWEKIHLILRLTLLQKEHKQLAFIMIHSIVKDKDGYILTGSVKRKFMVNLRPFHWLKRWTWRIMLSQSSGTLTLLCAYCILTLMICHWKTLEAISKGIIATAKSLKKWSRHLKHYGARG